MARRKPETGEDRTAHITPAQDDEADILEEVGAAPDENGDLLASEERIRDVGAVDSESVRENRRRDDIVKKKRGHVPNVSFNTGDALDTYDTILRVFPTNAVEIRIKNLRTGTTHTITSRPKTGNELYDALLAAHGQQEAAEYEVIFVDSVRKGWLGKPRIGLPDTRPPTQQGQQPMSMPAYPYPPGYPPPGYPPPPAQAAPQQQPAQGAPPPVIVHAPPPPPPTDPMAMMTHMFGLFQQMRETLQPQTPLAPPPSAGLPPPPPATADLATQMAWMQNALQLFQQMQSTVQPAHAPPAAAPAAPVAPAQAGPPGPPPPGMMWAWYPNYGFALVPDQNAAPAFRPRTPYSPQGERSNGAPSHHPPPQQQQPQRPLTPTEQARDAMGTIRSLLHMAEEMRAMLPGGGDDGGSAPQTVTEDDESPIRIIEAGGRKLLLNKEDGGLRIAETLFANMDGIFKFAKEQHEIYQRNVDKRRATPQRRQLPPGYVEVGPGYKPPDGFVAVPVEQEHVQTQQQDLPPPPEDTPPPVQDPPRQGWGMPTIPEGEG